MIKLQTFKIFSELLLYPDNNLKNHINYAYDLLKKEGMLTTEMTKNINIFVSYIKTNDILYLQETYVSIFDRQKQFSLYLFEHIHGDSRDRGMAMIDLKNLYEKSSIEISKKNELPDFIPIFLEYLSINSKNQATLLLGEIINIISILYLRLKAIESPYYVIFYALESLSSVKPDKKIINNLINKDKDFKLHKENIDKDWEEPKVF